MSNLRVLLLEDNPLDAELILAHLGGSDELDCCESERVQTRAEFEAALRRGGWDLILADYSLPQFDGLAALDLARDHAADVPFLFVSGAMGEEVAIESLKRGATDYVLKHRLERLVPAARRALAEARDKAELRQLQEALRQRAEELARADRRKDEFIAMLAHELRNPLAPVKNALQIMRLRGLPDAAFQQAWDIMKRQVEQLGSLVDDLLDVSRITRGKVHLKVQKTDLAMAITVAVDATRPLVEKRNHTLNVSLPPDPVWVNADPTRLAQVATNLLTNAAKYTDPGGTIDVAGRAEDGQAILTVRDTGIGIDPAVQARVFDLFVQTDDSLDRSQGGLGIGLTLARRLVELHGGTIGVTSEGRGKGSEFTVRLPLWKDEGARAKDESKPGLPSIHLPPASLQKKVAVVDDNKDGAESLALLLKLWGHEPVLAFDGAAALKLVEAERPDLVLLDIGLPRMDGYQVARQIRDSGDKATVLVALTGYGQEEDRRKSRAAGFDHHLTKPVDPEALQAVIAAGEHS